MSMEAFAKNTSQKVTPHAVILKKRKNPFLGVQTKLAHEFGYILLNQNNIAHSSDADDLMVNPNLETQINSGKKHLSSNKKIRDLKLKPKLLKISDVVKKTNK